MSKRDEILAANAEGTLLSAIAEYSYSDEDCLSKTLSQLHNSGEIDLSYSCRIDQMNTISGHLFFNFKRVLCKTLPQLDCTAEEASAVCQILYKKAAGDLTASIVYDALRQWFENDIERVEDGLALISRDDDMQAEITRCVLLAGSAHNLEKYAREALKLSQSSQQNIRIGSLIALGYMPFEKESQSLLQTMRRLNDALEVPHSDQETGIATEAVLNILGRLGANLVDRVEPLLLKACANPNYVSRRAIANGLLANGKFYTDPMICASFDALKGTCRNDAQTIQLIDDVLCQWDMDDDRERVFDLLTGLLNRDDDAINIDELENFQHRLTNGPGSVLGWHVVTLLLTGNDRLCKAANQLLPYREAPYGLDIDLTPFALDPPWILFLARKLLGYCLINAASTSALLLTCLRSVSKEYRSELEDLIFDYFLINYPGAIKQFESILSKKDPARVSVKCLSRRIEEYLERLRKSGICDAFKPGEREGLLQFHRKSDFWQKVHEDAEKHSALFQLAHKAVLLYGTRPIVYTYTGDESDPVRKEIALGNHEFTAEFPRLESIDPVGLQYATRRFRSEPLPS